MIAWLRARPGPVLLALAVVAASALYATSLGFGIVGYDDTWLVRDNWVLHHASWSTLHTIFLDLDSPRRFVLAPEYLPARDVSVMLDFAVWGDWYAGHHLTNLVIYVAAIALWYRALVDFGLERTLAGLAVLLWAVHPSHAESVAWLAERKGLLGVMFAGAAAVGYARFRAGAAWRWLVLAVVCAVAAVWSKAIAAFAIAALGGLELVLPARRVSWRRSAIGLGALAVAGAAAFAPVVMLASRSAVIGATSAVPGSRLAAVLGVHGFYTELAAMIVPSAPSYPIASHGPTIWQIVLGAVALAGGIAALAVPRAPRALRAAILVWLLGWLPVSHLVPLHMVAVADRYLLVATLGSSLALAAGITAIRRPFAIALASVIVLVAVVRTIDATASWSDPRALWSRAVASDPDDGDAWSFFALAYSDLGDAARARAIVAEGLSHAPTPRLLLRAALLAGSRDESRALMRRAAAGGEPRAMSNLALLLDEDGKADDALDWARRAVAIAPQYAAGQRVLGKLALKDVKFAEALAAFEVAYGLEPDHLENRYNLALALVALGRIEEARPHLEACLGDRRLGPVARAVLAQHPRDQQHQP